ncbi:MAG: hypothetical protein LBI64_03665 [Coriobacteriales bacterium]|jgi:hypothetical protein|nr:hypothetical protein [Coriobacteriales bacterium]
MSKTKTTRPTMEDTTMPDVDTTAPAPEPAPEPRTVVTQCAVNLRSAPNMKASTTALQAGRELVATGEAVDGWLPVEGGYIRHEFVQ